MDVATTASACVEVLSFHAGSQGYLGDSDIVLSRGGLLARRTDVGYSTTAGTECSISMFADDTFADDFTIGISKEKASQLVFICALFGRGSKSVRSVINANVSSSCKLYVSSVVHSIDSR